MAETIADAAPEAAEAGLETTSPTAAELPTAALATAAVDSTGGAAAMADETGLATPDEMADEATAEGAAEASEETAVVAAPVTMLTERVETGIGVGMTSDVDEAISGMVALADDELLLPKKSWPQMASAPALTIESSDRVTLLAAVALEASVELAKPVSRRRYIWRMQSVQTAVESVSLLPRDVALARSVALVADELSDGKNDANEVLPVTRP